MSSIYYKGLYQVGVKLKDLLSYTCLQLQNLCLGQVVTIVLGQVVTIVLGQVVTTVSRTDGSANELSADND